MLVKGAILIVLFLAALAMIGRWLERHFPKARRRVKTEEARACPRCGTYLIAPGPCACFKGKG